jgi:hypothetical protein
MTPSGSFPEIAFEGNHRDIRLSRAEMDGEITPERD